MQSRFPRAMNNTNPLIQQFKKYGTLSSIAETAIEQKTKIFIKKKNCSRQNY